MIDCSKDKDNGWIDDLRDDGFMVYHGVIRPRNNNYLRLNLGYSPTVTGLTNQCTRIATLPFYNGYTPAKKWVIGATIAHPQSRDFKR